KGRLDPPDSDLLAAADDRVRRRKLEVGPGRRIEPPQRLLETPMTAERAKRRGDGARHRGIGVPELGGGRMADNGALRERRPRPAEAGAVAEAEHAGKARPPLVVDDRRELTLRLVEDMAAAERAQDLIGRLEAIAEADRIDRE